MLNEESKNAANVIYGIFKVMIGLKMKTLDNFQFKIAKIRHQADIMRFGHFKNI
jgi:hypothetical protein